MRTAFCTMSHPHVNIPAPVIFFASLLAAWAIHQAGFGLYLSTHTHVEILLRVCGQIVLAASMLLMGCAMHTFRRHGTAIMPNQPAQAVVQSGPYRYTRNPMYLGLTFMQLGLGLIYNSLWPLLWLPVVVLLVRYHIIEREERYLHGAFGSVYEQYCNTTGRWLSLGVKSSQPPQ